MPAEWEPHEATWLSWPHNVETWPGKRLAKVEDTYLQMLEGLLPNEKVHLLVAGLTEAGKVEGRLKKMGIRTKNLILHLIPTVDTWIRDYGPTFVVNRDKEEKAWNKWIFNAWGGKYPSLMEDTHVFEDKSLIGHRNFDVGIILEGGSIEVNGAGTCLTTEQCLLNKNRNPKLSREEIENYLKDYLGVSNIVWLGEGIAGDDTDGHVDDITRFVNPSTILTVFEEDAKDENYHPLKENWELLKSAEKPSGGKWEVLKFPMPGKIADGNIRLPASYANFYIANGVVLVPVYGHKNDNRAVKILQELFPKREILPIRCNDLVYGLGAIHCVSQQEPA
jgi:agmatine deiminase